MDASPDVSRGADSECAGQGLASFDATGLVLAESGRDAQRCGLMDLRDRFARPACCLRPAHEGAERYGSLSWFGRVTRALPGEPWPADGNNPMRPLCQLDLREAELRPAALEGIALLTLFVSAQRLPHNDPNGTSWCLRAYGHRDSELLIPMEAPPGVRLLNAVPFRFEPICEDFPSRLDLPGDIPDELADSFRTDFPNRRGSKLCGWPRLVQSAINWAPCDAGMAPEYILQIDSEKLAGWEWGDDGTAYIGHGTTAGESHRWALSWQCY